MSEDKVVVSSEERKQKEKNDYSRVIIKLVSKSRFRRVIPVSVQTKKKEFKVQFRKIGEHIKVSSPRNQDIKITIGRILSREYLINTSKKSSFTIEGPGYVFKVYIK